MLTPFRLLLYPVNVLVGVLLPRAITSPTALLLSVFAFNVLVTTVI